MFLKLKDHSHFKFCFFKNRVVMFDNANSGYMMLLGQVADAISTIFVGFFSDKTRNGIFGYGRRKSWHMIGNKLIFFAFKNSPLFFDSFNHKG